MQRLWLMSLLASVIFCTGATPCTPADTYLSVWSEYQADADIRRSLSALGAQGISLYLNIPAERVGDPAMASLIREAGRQGVFVKAWLTLPEEEGYWPGETNRASFRQIVERFVAWAKQEDLPTQWVIFDMETDLATSKALLELAEAFATGDLQALQELYKIFAGNFDPAAFLEAAHDYAEIVDFLHSEGFFAQVTTYPTVVDDMADDDTDLQDISNIPVWIPETPIHWDLFSFMVYRTAYGEDRFSGDLIYSYASDIVRFFGERGGIDLGIVGYDPLTDSGYKEVSSLQEDYAAAMAARISNIHVYSLGGIVQMTPACFETIPCPWLDLSLVTPEKPSSEPLVGIMRRNLRHVDLWLNLQ